MAGLFKIFYNIKPTNRTQSPLVKDIHEFYIHLIMTRHEMKWKGAPCRAEEGMWLSLATRCANHMLVAVTKKLMRPYDQLIMFIIKLREYFFIYFIHFKDIL